MSTSGRRTKLNSHARALTQDENCSNWCKGFGWRQTVSMFENGTHSDSNQMLRLNWELVAA